MPLSIDFVSCIMNLQGSLRKHYEVAIFEAILYRETIYVIMYFGQTISSISFICSQNSLKLTISARETGQALV